MGHESRTRLLTVVVLVVVFGSGVLLGAVLDTRLGAEEPTDTVVAVGNAQGESADEDPPRRVPTYMQVEPNEEQLERINQIVAEYRARVNVLDEENRKRYRADFQVIRDDARDAIKGVLSSEQAAQYQQLLDERDASSGGSSDEDDQR